MGGIQGPIVGYLTDRYGPGVMLAFGGLASGLGFILLSLTGNYFFFLLVFVGLMSVGFRSGYNNATIAAINNWFRRRRGLAMSFVSMGHGLGGAIAPLGRPDGADPGLASGGAHLRHRNHRVDYSPVLSDQAVAGKYGTAARRRPPGAAGRLSIY